MTHGRTDEAEEMAGEIEDDVRRYTGREELPEPEDGSITVGQRGSIGFGLIARAMFRMYSKRTLLGLAPMASQAFLYNAIFFTYALVLQKFYKVPASAVARPTPAEAPVTTTTFGLFLVLMQSSS